MNREEKNKYIIELVKERRGEIYFEHLACYDSNYYCYKYYGTFDISFENFYEDPVNSEYIEEYYEPDSRECTVIIPIMYYLTLKYYNMFDLCLKENILDYIDNHEYVLLEVLNTSIPLMIKWKDEYNDDRYDGSYPYSQSKTYDIDNKHLKFVVNSFLEHSKIDINKKNVLGNNILLNFPNNFNDRKVADRCLIDIELKDGMLIDDKSVDDKLEDNDILDIILKHLNIDDEEKTKLLIHFIENNIYRGVMNIIIRILKFLDCGCKHSIFYLEKTIISNNITERDWHKTSLRKYVKCKRQQLVVFRRFYRKNIMKR
jgi:hypothetical protein